MNQTLMNWLNAVNGGHLKSLFICHLDERRKMDMMNEQRELLIDNHSLMKSRESERNHDDLIDDNEHESGIGRDGATR